MEDKLLGLKNTSCLNELHFGLEHKSKVLASIKNGPSTTRKKNLWYKKGLSVTVLTCLLILVVGIVVNKTGIFKSNSGIVAVGKIEEIKELQDVPFSLKLPTYLPFDVAKVNFSQTYVGPRDASNPELKQGDWKYYISELMYVNQEDEKLRKMITVSFTDITSRNFDMIQGSRGEKVKINGNNGNYTLNGSVQMLSWEDDDLFYDIMVMVQNKKNPKGDIEPLYTKEEIIKIAESFQTYRP